MLISGTIYYDTSFDDLAISKLLFTSRFHLLSSFLLVLLDTAICCLDYRKWLFENFNYVTSIGRCVQAALRRLNLFHFSASRLVVSALNRAVKHLSGLFERAQSTTLLETYIDSLPTSFGALRSDYSQGRGPSNFSRHQFPPLIIVVHPASFSIDID